MTELAHHLEITPPVFSKNWRALVASGFDPVDESMAARLDQNSFCAFQFQYVTTVVPARNTDPY
jgi:hypothetical protein